MLQLLGEYRGVLEDQRTYNGETWVEKSIQIRDTLPNGREVTYEAKIPKDFDLSSLPASKGGQVAAEVSVKAWKSKAGNVGVEYVAWRVIPAAVHVAKAS